MTYEMYRYIFIGGAILAGVMLVVSVIAFILLKIPTVIGDLTGANARKAIANIRSQNENTGDKTYRSSQVNKERGKLTDKISPSGSLIKNPSHSLHGAMGTEKISTQRLRPEDAAKGQSDQSVGHSGGLETTVLSGGSETTVLAGGSETTVLAAGSETTVLTGGAETTVLAGGLAMTATPPAPVQKSEATGVPAVNAQSAATDFVIEYEITYIHTGEMIA